MQSLIEKLDPDIEATIAGLSKTKFKTDPVAGEKYSRITSVVSSAYKRHGNILHKAMLEKLRENPNLQVWDDPLFQIPIAADHLVASLSKDPSNLIKSKIPYVEKGDRTLQVDVIVFNKEKNEIRAYEIKRGFGRHDSGKIRSILRDTLCIQVLLASYAETKGLKADSAFSHVIFYYGKKSIQPPFGLSREDLNSHFGFEVIADIEKVNSQFQSKLFEILEK